MPRTRSNATSNVIASGRRFGVEIEFVGISIEQAITALENAGIPVNRRLSYGYNHTNQAEAWKVVTDASVAGGAELVSPILSGSEGIEAARKAAEAIDAAGATANRTCGLHVHVSADGLTARDIGNLARRYAKFEEDIDLIMPRSRRGNSNRYCQSFKSWYDSSAVVRAFERAESVRSACGVQYDRFKKLNLTAYARHNTVEFRQHSGTVNANKITNWIKFCVNFVETSKVTQRRGRTASGARGSKQLANMHKIVRCLRAAGYVGATPERLCTETGLTASSLNVYVSKLRTVYGFRIRKHRNGGFVLVRDCALPALAVEDINALDTNGNADVRGDSAFRGLPQNVVNFYNERREDLA